MASAVPNPHSLESKMHEREDHALMDYVKVYDFKQEDGHITRNNANRKRNSKFEDQCLVPRLEGTQLRWIRLKDTDEQTTRSLKSFYHDRPGEDIEKHLFRNSSPKFCLGPKFAQDYMEYFSTFRCPIKKNLDGRPSPLDDQLGIYFPYFQYQYSTGAETPTYPGLVQYSHSFNEPWPRSSHHSLPIVVQQMWLFVIDSQTIASYFPDEPTNSASRNASLFDTILKRGSLAGSYRRDPLDDIEDAYLMAANMVRRAAFLNIRGWLVPNSLLPKIEQKVGNLSQKRNKAYEVFQRPIHGSRLSSTPSEISRVHEKDLLLETMAFVEELKSFINITECQIDIVRRMKDFFDNDHEKPEPVKLLSTTLDDLNELISMVNRAAANATQIQASVLQLLDLRQKEDTLTESQFARVRAEEVARQGRTIMVFTIFTVIFLPISVFTSYFGMNVNDFIGFGDTTQTHFWIICGPLWIAVILLTLLLAFYHESVDFMRKVKDNIFTSLIERK